LIDLPRGTKTFLGVFASDEIALSSPGELRKVGLRPSILEYLDQWTIDCLQKYVGTEVFPGIDPKPMLLIEVDGSPPEVEEQSKILTEGLEKTALGFRTAQNGGDAEKIMGCSPAGFLIHEKTGIHQAQ
jgi:glycolate oxidase